MGEPGPGRWLPRAARGWVLLSVAIALAVPAVLMSYYALVPIGYDGAGKFGFIALLFAPQLLAVTGVAALLYILARRVHARVSAALFGLAALLTASISLWTMGSMWQMAQRNHVLLSLADALVPHLNGGGPQPGRSVSYGTAADGTRLMLDVWRAPGAGAGALHPAIVRVHGGAWTHGARSEMWEWDKWLNRLGYEVFDVEYRMPPPERWRDEVGDVKCAIGWVAAHAAEYQVDPKRISVMGYSAGAHLAMLAAYSVGDPRLPASCAVQDVKIRSVVNLYGPTDLPAGYEHTGSPRYVHQAFRQFIGGAPGEFAERYRILSPVNYVHADSPPTISFLGTSDRIVDLNQAVGLTRALAKAGAAHETYLLPLNDHGFDANWSSPGAQFARAKVEAFLHKHG